MVAKNGKPHFTRTRMSFNISHSGNYVVIVVSDFNIGIDIQRMEKHNHLIAEKISVPMNVLISMKNDNYEIKDSVSMKYGQ